jgi:glycosyltransferase involved in cell wall biosynthesis
MFRPEKNQRELIQLAAGIPASTDWQLWLAGEGPARAACEKLAAELGLTERVRFLGFLRDPAPLYAAADIAVHASASESLSNFLIEAQAHGLPAVAYTAQGIGECFIPGVTGWVIPRNEREAFLAALTPLFQCTDSDRAKLAAAARDYARNTFDPARQVAAYLELFANLNTRA